MEDYVATDINLTTQKQSLLSNVSYEWDKRVSIKTLEKKRIIWKRKAYKALACHKSQYAVLHAKSIVNDDNVFWNRRTDNLLCNSQLTASSGDAEKLRDFLILDTSNIIEKNPYLISYSRGTWAPDGNNAWVKAKWEKSVKFDRIIFHGSLNTIEIRPINLTIYVDGNVIGSVDKINPYGRDTIFKSDIIIECKELKIVFSCDNVELSEIEVLYGDMQLPFDTGRIKEIKRNKLVDTYSEFGFQAIVFTTRLTRKVKKLVAKVLHRT